MWPVVPQVMPASEAPWLEMMQPDKRKQVRRRKAASKEAATTVDGWDREVRISILRVL